MNIQQNINLLKLSRACVVSLQGRQEKVKGVFIPIEENDIYVTTNEDGSAKGAHLSITAWETKEQRFEQTHMVKQAFSKEYRERHTEEEMKAKPILGNGKVIESKSNNQSSAVNAPEMPFTTNEDDLPF